MKTGKQGNRMVINTTMLMIMNIAKLIFPLATLPYLTHVLSVDCYGMVSYVKTIMTYMQVLTDFGFVISATKDIVEHRNDPEKIGAIAGNAMLGRMLLAVAGCLILVPMVMFIPILQGYAAYVFLSQAATFLTCFFVEYLFRGIEQMHMITIRFVIMKLISVSLTFVLVQNDADVLWIPLLDIISYVIAAVLTMFQVRKLGIRIRVSGLAKVWASLKSSALYFLNNVASNAFNALNTLLIGIYCSAADVAYWSVCLQLILAVQCIYSPIADGIYPEMVKTKDFGIIRRILKIFIPLIICGCIFTVVVAKYVLVIVSGEKYAAAAPVLRWLTPVLFFSFYSYVLGYPALGAINRMAEVTKSTVISALLLVAGFAVMIVSNRFEIILVAILRTAAEVCLAGMRAWYCYRYRNEFSSGDLQKSLAE